MAGAQASLQTLRVGPCVPSSTNVNGSVGLFTHVGTFYLFFLKIYLFMIDTDKRERGRDTGRGRSRLHAGSLMWDSILGPTP